MAAKTPRIDTVQAKDCYDPADYTLVHNDHLAFLQAADPVAIKARCAELESCLRLFSIQCEELSHDKGEFHDYATPCPVVARVQRCLASADPEKQA